MAGMSVIHILVIPTGLDPLQKSLSQTEQCSGASLSIEQVSYFDPIFAQERQISKFPLVRKSRK